MAKKLYEESNIQAIADAIRGKCGTTCGYKTCDMAAAIDSITTGGSGGGEDTLAAFINGSITTYESELVTRVYEDALYSYSPLTEVSLPNATEVLRSAFRDCYNLVTVNLPNVTSIGNQSFYGCTKLTSITLPNLITMGQSAFHSCTNLAIVDLPKVTSIPMYAFYNCYDASLILRNETMVTLENANGFNGARGYIYVPSALVDTYKAGTNWSTYADQIRAIEDYPDITGG